MLFELSMNVVMFLWRRVDRQFATEARSMTKMFVLARSSRYPWTPILPSLVIIGL